LFPGANLKIILFENLIALCANCHERADTEKWGVSYLQRYKKSPCIIARGSPSPLTAEQKVLVDLIIARGSRSRRRDVYRCPAA
jgi:hypothetical protein